MSEEERQADIKLRALGCFDREPGNVEILVIGHVSDGPFLTKLAKAIAILLESMEMPQVEDYEWQIDLPEPEEGDR